MSNNDSRTVENSHVDDSQLDTLQRKLGIPSPAAVTARFVIRRSLELAVQYNNERKKINQSSTSESFPRTPLYKSARSPIQEENEEDADESQTNTQLEVSRISPARNDVTFIYDATRKSSVFDASKVGNNRDTSSDSV